MSVKLHDQCKALLSAYAAGALGQTIMPEDAHPHFLVKDQEVRISYFTLPMALNYQRNSYRLWEAALKTFNDPETRFVFDVTAVNSVREDEVRTALMRYKLALQPNKHVHTWCSIAKTVRDNWGSFDAFVIATEGDFLQLKQLVTVDHKKGFPYLSGPKIFNYWSFILSTYGGIRPSHREYIDIAPDTHITQCSVRLGVITAAEAEILPKEAISARWRTLLQGSGIDPIIMHPPLWFWSRNGFLYELPSSE